MGARAPGNPPGSKIPHRGNVSINRSEEALRKEPKRSTIGMSSLAIMAFLMKAVANHFSRTSEPQL